MYLVDTDVVSELRKGPKADAKVLQFFADADKNNQALYLSVVTIGELRRGVEIIRHRGDTRQASRLEGWLEPLLEEFSDHILEFGREEAQVWGRLRVPHPENAIDKLIAATAFTHGLVLVTRHSEHFSKLGLTVLNPFQ